MGAPLDRPTPKKRRAAPPPEGKHLNHVKGIDRAMHRGTKGKHMAVNMLKERKMAVTAPHLAGLNVCQSTPAFDVDLSRLHAELKEYWSRNGLNGGTYPDDAVLQVGSRIKLWAPKTHSDIGFAYAHPSLDGNPRFMHPA